MTRKWTTLRTIVSEKNVPAPELREKFSLILLAWLDKKWRLRCKMCEITKGIQEHGDLVEPRNTMWSTRDKNDFLHGDMFCWREKYSPKEHHTMDYLRSCIRTRELEMRVLKRVMRSKR